MLNEATIVTTIAVKDIAAGSAFYGTTLGLKQVSSNEAGVTYDCGGSELLVYQSEYAGTNKATAASFRVSDVRPVVKDLKSKGISFEHFDMPGATWDGDICVWGQWQTAWFKDPDGNILAVSNG